MSVRYRHHAFHTVKRRRRMWPVLLAFIVLLAGAYVYMALNRPMPRGSVVMNEGIVSQAEAAQIMWPTEGVAAIGTLNDGVIAQSADAESPRPIASLAKVITALAVLEKAPMQPGETGITVTFDTVDEDSFWEYVAKDGTVTAVKAGEQINQYQALQAMLLPSSNNMSDSLVRRVFGSMDAYRQYANDMVKRYGLKHTHVDDASGFSPQTVSTPAEMIVIGQKALEHPVVAEIVAQKEADIPIAGAIPNYNQLLKLEDVNGIKPGNTDEAGNCLLFSATYKNANGKDVTVIGVVLGIHTLGKIYDQSARLLRSVQINLRQVELIRGGQAVGVYMTPWGEQAELVAQESVWAYNIDSTPPAEFQSLDMPAVPVVDQPVGLITLGTNSRSVEVIADQRVKKPSIGWRLTHPIISRLVPYLR